jgi:hypothetical protein
MVVKPSYQMAPLNPGNFIPNPLAFLPKVVSKNRERMLTHKAQILNELLWLKTIKMYLFSLLKSSVFVTRTV